MFKAKEIIKEINKFSPEILLSCKNAISKSIFDLDFQRLDKVSLKNADISIDVAVMEKALRVVIPLDVGWSDVGSWEVVWETSKKILKKLYFRQGIFRKYKIHIWSEDRLIVGIDLNDLIVVETSAILISDKRSSQKVKMWLIG